MTRALSDGRSRINRPIGEHLVIGAAIGYDATMLKPFVYSALATLPKCHILLIYDEQPEDLIGRLGVEGAPVTVLQPPDQALRKFMSIRFRGRDRLSILSASLDRKLRRTKLLSKFSTAFMPPALARYFWALSALESIATGFKKVALSDTRDVVFQNDVFAKISSSELVSGLEPISIGRCKFTGHWVQLCYPSLQRSLADYLVVCSGFTVGGSELMKEYCLRMCLGISQLPPSLLGGTYLDQAVHNKIIYSDVAFGNQLRLVQNQEGIIATLSYQAVKEIDFGRSDGEISVDTKIPSVLHQYDRHPSLNDRISRFWAEPAT